MSGESEFELLQAIAELDDAMHEFMRAWNTNDDMSKVRYRVKEAGYKVKCLELNKPQRRVQEQEPRSKELPWYFHFTAAFVFFYALSCVRACCGG